MKQREVLTYITRVNGCEPAVYISYISQDFRMFHVSNLFVLNFRIVPLMYPGWTVEDLTLSGAVCVWDWSWIVLVMSYG